MDFQSPADLRAAFTDFLFTGLPGFLGVVIICLPSKFEVLPFYLRESDHRHVSRFPPQGYVSTLITVITTIHLLFARSYSRLPSASLAGCLPYWYKAVLGVSLLPPLDMDGLVPNSSQDMLIIHVNWVENSLTHVVAFFGWSLSNSLKLLAGDGDSNVRSIILHIPFSLALHRWSLSVLSRSSRISKASLSTARYIVPVAHYDPVTQVAVPVSYYSWKSRFLLRLPVWNNPIVTFAGRTLMSGPAIRQCNVSGNY